MVRDGNTFFVYMGDCWLRTWFTWVDIKPSATQPANQVPSQQTSHSGQPMSNSTSKLKQVPPRPSSKVLKGYADKVHEIVAKKAEGDEDDEDDKGDYPADD